jgi:hypothetical protein
MAASETAMKMFEQARRSAGKCEKAQGWLSLGFVDRKFSARA